MSFDFEPSYLNIDVSFLFAIPYLRRQETLLVTLTSVLPPHTPRAVHLIVIKNPKLSLRKKVANNISWSGSGDWKRNVKLMLVWKVFGLPRYSSGIDFNGCSWQILWHLEICDMFLTPVYTLPPLIMAVPKINSILSCSQPWQEVKCSFYQSLDCGRCFWTHGHL